RIEGGRADLDRPRPAGRDRSLKLVIAAVRVLGNVIHRLDERAPEIVAQLVVYQVGRNFCLNRHYRTSRALSALISSDRRPTPLVWRASYPKTVSHFSGCALIHPIHEVAAPRGG